MRVTILVTTTLLMLGAALIAGARFMGRQRLSLPTQIETGDCDQPCWQGVQLGVGTSSDFQTVSAALPVNVRLSTMAGVVTEIRVAMPRYTSLADVIQRFGPPDYADCSARYGSIDTHATVLSALSKLYFVDGRVEPIFRTCVEPIRYSFGHVFVRGNRYA